MKYIGQFFCFVLFLPSKKFQCTSEKEAGQSFSISSHGLEAGGAAACNIVIVGLADGGWGMLISRGGEDKGLGSS